ncbi:Lrp/AsnC family transcriptional regulator [Haloterrigena alkaliphila]|uniref:Winged helix-turn-helix transcriptional regulator n=1 Tax=Haloterrigena alkaliphila TaxID=2816475 RepID=A0A8A2VA56_9EURY|nr:winged helix-turn-helix transcriptional regulator [Haloterrigena alkaliphila]QSW98919.1 winged helix-turn-helix transcriptional regulator [Haloterrigena alkaliphila]
MEPGETWVRTNSTIIGEQIGVAASTVRNRINKMEDAGIIRGYHPEIDYDEAGYPLHYLFMCYASTDERTDLVEHVLETVPGVVRINELFDAEINVVVEVIAADAETLDATNEQLKACGLEVKRGEIYKTTHVQPYDHFGTDLEEQLESK